MKPQISATLPAAVTLVSGPVSATLGDTVTFAATVSADSGAPTGLVTFFDGARPLGSARLQSSGGVCQATFRTALLSPGSPHSITAVYQGNASFSAAASAPVQQSVLPRLARNSALRDNLARGRLPSGVDAFAPTGALLTGRTGFTATLFADGQALIAGGADASGKVLQSAEIYSASDARFSPAANLNVARTGAVALLLPTGKVLIAGGSADGTAGRALNTAELFDPLTAAFTPTSENMIAARIGATAVLLNDGRVLVAGGENSGGPLHSAELYDPATDSFAPTGDLHVARTGASAILLGAGADATVLIAGGSGDATSVGALNSAELFDPTANHGAGSFTSIPSTLNAARWQPQAALLQNGRVLIAGGQNATGFLAGADLYDPAANAFTPSTAQMTRPRANGIAVALPNGKVLIAGGISPASPAAELYDPNSDSFAATGSLRQLDAWLGSALLNNGQVLVAGITAADAGRPDAELYTPDADSRPAGTDAPPTIAKAFFQDFVAPNATLGMGFSIINPNPSDTLTGISFTDALPAGLVVATPNGLSSSCGGTFTAVPGSSSISLTGGTVAPEGPPPMYLPGGKRGRQPRDTAQGECVITLNMLVSGAGIISNTTGPISANESGAGDPSNTATVEVVQPPTLMKTFGADSVIQGQGTTLTFNLSNPNADVNLSNVSFTDSLPAGLIVASPNGLTGSCVSGGGLISAVAGSGTISMSNVSLAGIGVCAFSLNVTATSGGLKQNTTSAVTATFDDGTGLFRLVTGIPASNTLAVIAPPTLAKSFTPSTIAVNASSTLTFTVSNPTSASILQGIGFTDTLPSGLAVSSTPNVGGTCVGNGTITASANATSVGYSGGSLSSGASCTITMSVTASSPGTLTNTTSAISSTSPATTGVSATATLIVLPATYMNANSGTTPQSAQVTNAFGTLLSVTVLASDDATPVPGIAVTFTAPSTGATGTFANSTNTTSATTNAAGVATATVFTANTTEGGPYNVTATAASLPTVNFALTNLAGPPTQMAANAGATPQSTQVATAFGTLLSVTVKDQYNNLVPGIAVTFTAPSSGPTGVFANSTHTTAVATNSSGVATATVFTAGTLAGGPYNVTASASGPPSVNFSMTNTPGPAARILAHAGTPQTAQVTKAFATLLEALVEDQYNNPVSSPVTVTFTAPSSGATGAFANSTHTTSANTNASGIATASVFTANTLAGGPYNVLATASGLPTALFSLTNTAGPVRTLTAVPGATPQSALVGTAFAVPLSVLLEDQYNNPVSGVLVSFSVPASGPSGTFANHATSTETSSGGNGIATATTLTANSLAGGPYTASAAVSGAGSVSFALTNLPLGAATLLPNPVHLEMCDGSTPSATVTIQTPAPESFTVSLEAEARNAIQITPSSGQAPLALTISALPDMNAHPGRHNLRYLVTLGDGTRLQGSAVLHVCGPNQP